jgi:hypothetical protein
VEELVLLAAVVEELSFHVQMVNPDLRMEYVHHRRLQQEGLRQDVQQVKLGIH